MAVRPLLNDVARSILRAETHVGVECESVGPDAHVLGDSAWPSSSNLHGGEIGIVAGALPETTMSVRLPRAPEPITAERPAACQVQLTS